MTDTRMLAPWINPMGRTDTSIHSPGTDLAELAAMRARMDEVARLLAFPSALAARGDIPGTWPGRDKSEVVMHRDPNGATMLLRGRVRDPSVNLRDHIRMQVVRSPFLETFIIEEDVIPTGLNIPTHGEGDQPARLWFERLRSMFDTLDARVRRHGRMAGDPYHEIGQTIEGKVVTRVRELLVRSGTRDLNTLGLRVFAPSPYAPLDCHVVWWQSSSMEPIAKLQSSIAEAWSSKLGSTIQMRAGTGNGHPSIIFERPSTSRHRADAVDSAMDAMRAVAAFPNDLERPFVQVPPKR